MNLESSTIKIGDAISYLAMETYPGGKSVDGTYQQIINQILPHDSFITGFLGHCGITRIKKPASVTVGIELDKKVYDTWSKLMSDNQNHPLMKNLTICHGAFLDLIDNWIKQLNNPFVYLDPPYPKQSRKSQKDLYNCEMTKEDHDQLLNWCVGQNVPIAISTYPNPQYADWLSQWRSITYNAKTRKGTVKEMLYMNYPEPQQLHDYRFIGKDYREREKFKRRCKSMMRKFKQLTPLEQAMLQQQMEDHTNIKVDAAGNTNQNDGTFRIASIKSAM